MGLGSGSGGLGLLWPMIGWIFLAIVVLMLGHSVYSLVESLRAQPPRKGRAAFEAAWTVLLVLLLLWNLRAVGLINLPLP